MLEWDLISSTWHPLGHSQNQPLNVLPKRKVFHSADFGASWTEITPTGESQVVNLDAAIQVLAAGKTLLVLGVDGISLHRWRKNLDPPQIYHQFIYGTQIPSRIAINERIFYKADAFGVSRTTDAGESWHPFVKGMTGPLTHDVVVLNNRLYMHIGSGNLVQSTDGGETWESAHFNTHAHTPPIRYRFLCEHKVNDCQ